MSDVLLENAFLAEKVLTNCQSYTLNKKIIFSLFEKSNNALTKEIIMLRLTVIDSFYSTQMNKRLYGIDEVVDKIFTISSGKDSIILEKVKRFSEKGEFDDELFSLFLGKYGIKKNGSVFGKATSLISKYLYFLSKFDFPIYDSLVQVSIPALNEKYKITNNIKFDGTEKEYFESIYNFKKSSKISSFNQLDNLCWLYGKVKKGSLSLIIDKDKYISLVDKLNLSNVANIDNEIRTFIMKSASNDIFTEDQIKFISFVYN